MTMPIPITKCTYLLDEGQGDLCTLTGRDCFVVTPQDKTGHECFRLRWVNEFTEKHGVSPLDIAKR